ncbi:MAG: hypothetical protein IKG40_01880 [Bacilli bacterium]|nr:hypothetical protein [Bacilli bacterium]
MKFEEIFKFKNSPYEIILGYNENRILKTDLCENASVLITGSTGTSKSILMHEILLQLVMNLKEDVKIVPMAFNKVELREYADSKYGYSKLIDNDDEAIKSLEKINDLILERKKAFLENNVNNFKEYIKIKNEPFIVIAIDEASSLLTDKRGSDEIFKIVEACNNVGVAIIVNTNNVYNDFFEKDINLCFSNKVSFDFNDREQSILNNIKNSENLNLRKFLFKKERNAYEYNMYDFDEKYINTILK